MLTASRPGRWLSIYFKPEDLPVLEEISRLQPLGVSKCQFLRQIIKTGVEALNRETKEEVVL